ncbi:hypothetical protein [Legionella clemsonensis]|uniref:ATP-grasp domain-containing protein n=1 Tax=Legionella clemsonensis TaxID=1867846 RepID=A0A222NYE6_9GAMM|nr:hypothetical protein [Legionella clemsonensis]ASQ44610.1 hypothetical protein clem_00215 [Legionella clemsonensis]
MNVLIVTEPEDLHAQLVKLALHDRDHACTLWYIADMPTKQMNSIYCSNERYTWLSKSSLNEVEIAADKFDIVWWRRVKRPFVPFNVHKNDFDFIKKENNYFCGAIPLSIVKGPWWINPYESINYASSKPYQLKLASASGFKIPSTLISNSPEHIKAFIAANKKNEVIYKSFCSHHWYENERLKLSYTQSVTLEQLPSDPVLQMTPGMFQEKLKKKYELRVTAFGDYLVAVKINSQGHPKGLADWRVIPPLELKIEPYSLSSEVSNMIRIFMKNLGIVFGCFDFVVTPEDEIYFLEVNQQGQFLWIEELLPEMKMLNTFVSFLLQKKRSFNGDNAVEVFSLKDYESRAFQIIEQNRIHHICLNAIKKPELAI